MGDYRVLEQGLLFLCGPKKIAGLHCASTEARPRLGFCGHNYLYMAPQAKSRCGAKHHGGERSRRFRANVSLLLRYWYKPQRRHGTLNFPLTSAQLCNKILTRIGPHFLDSFRILRARNPSIGHTHHSHDGDHCKRIEFLWLDTGYHTFY